MMADIIAIDGSQGEGGGQVLRTSLSLSAVTGCPIRLERIRAGRSKPGLAAQHLTACRAVAQVCGGTVEGAELGSQALSLYPGALTGGEFVFEIGTAGSTTLLLQSLLPALLFAPHPSHLILRGGTENPWAPVFDYLQDVFLPVLTGTGVRVRLQRKRAGWYPAGGGELEAFIEPLQAPLQPLRLTDRGALTDLTCHSLASDRLPAHILARQCRGAKEKLGKHGRSLRCLEQSLPAYSPGTTCTVVARFENGAGGFTALGKRGRPAEAVGAEAGEAAALFLRLQAAVDEHLADQLLLYAALAAGESVFTAPHLTGHVRTNADVIHQLIGVQTTFRETPAGAAIAVAGSGQQCRT